MTTMTDGTPPRATMKDVARLADVSLKTVSRVVNGEANVSDELIERVQVAARQLGYKPNFTASNLRRSPNSTKTVGLLLENVANPFSSSLLRAIEDVAAQRGVVVVAASLDEDPSREQELAMAFLARQMDGLIIAPSSSDQSYLTQELASGTPLAFVDRPPQNVSADSVSSDNVGGARMAVDQLIALGHQDIAFIGDYETISTAGERLTGYQEAMTAAGLRPRPEHVVTDIHSMDEAERETRKLLLGHHPPTALFTAQNLITIGAVRALRALDMHNRVALIGFDDFMLADLLTPPVAVVEQDIYSMGRTAANLLFDRIDRVTTGSRTEVRIPTSLILRASGEIPPPPGQVA